MRIIWITPGFAADDQDHNCIPPLQLLARALVRFGVDLHIIALEYPFTSNVYAWDHPGATVYPCNGRNRRWMRWQTFARARAYAQQIQENAQTALVHSFWLGPAWILGEQFCARWGIPHRTTLMGQDVLPGNRYLRRLNAGHAGRLIALSGFHAAALEKTCGFRPGHCIPWGIVAQELPAHLPRERPVDVLGAGALLPVKNWSRWLRVLRLVADAQPALRAMLIGAGPEKHALQTLARQLDLGQTVTFAGQLPRAQVLEAMHNSRVLLHTANFESFGYVLAEAAAHGCRVVSTPVGTAPDIGVCAGSDTGLATAVLHALTTPATGNSGRVARMEDVAEAYLALYASALGH